MSHFLFVSLGCGRALRKGKGRTGHSFWEFELLDGGIAATDFLASLLDMGGQPRISRQLIEYSNKEDSGQN